jgi:hypothetical protein
MAVHRTVSATIRTMVYPPEVPAPARQRVSRAGQDLRPARSVS